MRLLEVGGDIDYTAGIVKSDLGEVKDGSIILDMTAGTRYTANVELNEHFIGAIKVVANEI